MRPMKEILGLDLFTDKTKLVNLGRALTAELIGTMLLCIVGCGSALNWKTSFDVTQISLAFGLAVMAIATFTGGVSGGNLNPAVSLGLMVGGELEVLKGLLYIVVQVIGAIVGVGVLKAVTPVAQQDGFGANGINSFDVGLLDAAGKPTAVAVTAGGAVLIEAILTMMLVLVVYGSAVDPKTKAAPGVAPLLIGLTVAAAHLVCITYTGTSINPARSVGSAVFAKGAGAGLWIFWVGPMVGGAVGGLLYTFVFQDKSVVEK